MGMDTAIIQLFAKLLGLGVAVGVAVCAVFIAMAGFQYMSAGGNSRQMEGAKQSLFSALIGLAIVLAAHVLATTIQGAMAGIPTS